MQAPTTKQSKDESTTEYPKDESTTEYPPPDFIFWRFCGFAADILSWARRYSVVRYSP